MIQTLLQEKYPIYTLELDKSETSCESVSDIIARFKERIDANPDITYIGIFDHHAHGSSDSDSPVKDAKNIIFCFGKEIPHPRVLAVRPRSIGVAELDRSFVVTFLEAPNPAANEAMETWTKQLKDR